MKKQADTARLAAANEAGPRVEVYHKTWCSYSRVAEEEVKAFLAAGFTKAQVLEVILAFALNLISNYTNQVADIPLDEAFQAYRWDGQKVA